MFLKYKCLIILLLFLTGNMMTEAQELIAPTDTVMAVVGDTVVSAGQDSVLALDSVPKTRSGRNSAILFSKMATNSMNPRRCAIISVRKKDISQM